MCVCVCVCMCVCVCVIMCGMCVCESACVHVVEGVKSACNLAKYEERLCGVWCSCHPHKHIRYAATTSLNPQMIDQFLQCHNYIVCHSLTPCHALISLFLFPYLPPFSYLSQCLLSPFHLPFSLSLSLSILPPLSSLGKCFIVLHICKYLRNIQ